MSKSVFDSVPRYYVQPLSLATRVGTTYAVKDSQTGHTVYTSKVKRYAIERAASLNQAS